MYAAAGAKIVYGDVVDGPGADLIQDLGSERLRFVHCDTSSYTDQLALFATAAEAFGGRIDVVVANAGIAIHKDPFAVGEDISVAPSMAEIDVNLKGPLYTTRIGLHHLRQNPDGGGDIVLVSSIAGFKESGGLVAYTASKHGVIGIMRGLHITAIKENVRVNVICPWMTSMFICFFYLLFVCLARRRC